MKQRPILFSGPMVRAILEGRKTMTRRVMKRQPTAQAVTEITPGGQQWAIWPDGDEEHPNRERFCVCPYGKPGDRLWVRETFRSFSQRHLKDHDATYPSHQHYAHFPDCITIYKADGVELPEGHKQHSIGWAPSIHMHRYESRITLEVVSVRVERLQAISCDDLKAEGAEGLPREGVLSRRNDCHDAMQGFAQLWDSLNAQRGYGWESNPWVWVVSFKRPPTAPGTP